MSFFLPLLPFIHSSLFSPLLPLLFPPSLPLLLLLPSSRGSRTGPADPATAGPMFQSRFGLVLFQSVRSCFSRFGVVSVGSELFIWFSRFELFGEVRHDVSHKRGYKRSSGGQCRWGGKPLVHTDRTFVITHAHIHRRG